MTKRGEPEVKVKMALFLVVNFLNVAIIKKLQQLLL